MLEELFEKERLFWKKSKIQNVPGTVGKKFSLGLLKVFATFPEEKFHEKRTLLLKKPCNFRVCAVFFRFFGRNVPVRSSKLHFSCPEDSVSWRTFPLRKFDLFFGFWSWRKTDLIVLRKHFDSSSEVANYLSTETIWRKNNFFFFTNLFFLVWGPWQRLFWSFRHYSFLSVLSNLHSTYPEERFDENSSFQKPGILYQFKNLIERSPDFLLKKFCTDVETVLRCPVYI